MLFLLPLLFVMYDQSNLLIKIQSLYSSHPAEVAACCCRFLVYCIRECLPRTPPKKSVELGRWIALVEVNSLLDN
jgi:hypothetical protein